MCCTVSEYVLEGQTVLTYPKASLDQVFGLVIVRDGWKLFEGQVGQAIAQEDVFV